jgi:hypothetical protein
MMLICQPKFTKDVAPCFVLRDNRSLIGILRKNGLGHFAHSYPNIATVNLHNVKSNILKEISLEDLFTKMCKKIENKRLNANDVIVIWKKTHQNEYIQS